MRFGAKPLSHPLLVEAIEEEFVPVCVHNNKKGKDAEILQRFGEPSWNNPVVRFLSANGKDLIPRKDGVWDTGALAQRMVKALEAAHRPVPRYLDLVAVETDASKQESATFVMHCFWVGESRLGSLDGVINTRAAWRGGREVVEVTYRPDRVSYEELLIHAQRMQCADGVFSHSEQQRRIAEQHSVPVRSAADAKLSDAKESDRRRAMRGRVWNLLPLTPAQATKVNAMLSQGKDPSKWLSPRQRRWKQEIEVALAEGRDLGRAMQRPESWEALAAYQATLRGHLGSG